MRLRFVVLKYAFFGIVATAANLFMQRGVFLFKPDGNAFYLAISAGAGVGLVVKYTLDKRWIFKDHASGVGSHTRKFTRYVLMGLFTTLIFWGFETGFWLLWRTEPMREAGAIIGLSIGYVIKYQLDRRFVFTDKILHEESSA